MVVLEQLITGISVGACAYIAILYVAAPEVLEKILKKLKLL
jgi:hypothetical protein